MEVKGMTIKKDAVSSSVKLKGVGDGISVFLDPTRPLETLQADLKTAFGRLKQVAFNARVILEPGGDEDHEELITTLGSFLKENFAVGSVTGPVKNRVESEERLRQKDMVQAWRNRRSDALILSGRVRSGQNVTARKHLILLGDVNPGGEVIAGGDVLILGSLFGTAAAGQPNHPEAIVLALDFRPMQVQVAGVIETGFASESTAAQAVFAYLKDGALKIEDYLKAGPFKRLSWPQVR